MEEESAEEKEVERQFDFVAEIAMLVDYNVIRIYVTIINHTEMSKNADLIIMVTHFLKRIVNQLKQVWIFFQFDFLAAFQIFLKEGQCNNSLMRGLNEVKADVVNRRLELTKQSLKEVITVIVGKFVELQKTNPMLAVEALFRY
jgi:hypothetical protein